jgi:hypothetical protein
VKKAIDIIKSTMKSRNFEVSVIYSDGEGAIGKIKHQLNKLGIEVDISGATGHVPLIERRIRVTKERTRAHMNGWVPFAPSLLTLAFLILFCISRLNYQHTSTRPGGLTRTEGCGLWGFSNIRRTVYQQRCEITDWSGYSVPANWQPVW